METIDNTYSNSLEGEHENYRPPHPSLTRDRYLLLLDHKGKHRDLCVEVIQKILPQAKIDIVSTPEESEKAYLETNYDTYVCNFLAKGVSDSHFVKEILSDPKTPLVVGFSLDQKQMSLEEEINPRPLQKIFEIN